MESHLIDTNAIIELFEDSLSNEKTTWLEELIEAGKASISVINQIELLGFNGPVEEMTVLEEFITHNRVFHLTESVIDQTILLRRDHKIKVPDAIIAATSLAYDLTLVTRNTKDFEDIESLKIVNSHS